MTEQARTDRGLDRLVNFSDATVAIAITILILPLVDLAGELTTGEGAGDLLREHWPALLDSLLQDPYFALPAPKSTGRDHFNLAWLMQHLPKDSSHTPADVQATLSALTAESTAAAIRSQRLSTVYVCGGGAENPHLLSQIQAAVGDQTRIETTAALGIHPQMVEATGFAWLARQRVHHQPIELTSITGARQSVILGARHKAPPAVP